VARKTLLATGNAKVLHHVQFKTAVQSNASNPQTGKSSLKEYGIKVWCFKNSSNKKKKEKIIYIIIVPYIKDIDFILATQRTIFQLRVKSPALLLVWCVTPSTVKV